MMAGNVFISYRRDDSAGHAGRVHDRLEREFGRDLLFMDVDSVPLGVNFVNVLSGEVAKCDVLLAVIGPNWLSARDEDGNRRLDNPHDFVRIEIGAALQRNIPVIPILLDGAKVPKAKQLPKELEELSLRNGLDVRHVSFHNDIDKLVRSLKGQLAEADARRRDEDERRRQEAEIKQRADERRRKVEAEKRQRDKEERRQQEAENKRRLDEAEAEKCQRAEEEHRRQEILQAEARRVAEAERRRQQEAEIKQRADEEERRRKAEAEESRRDEDERRRQEAEDRRRLDEAEKEKRRQEEERGRQVGAQGGDRALQAQIAREVGTQPDMEWGRDKALDEAAAREARPTATKAGAFQIKFAKATALKLAISIAILGALAAGITLFYQASSPIMQLEQAAAKGDANAMTQLGLSYHYGSDGVAQDFAKAHEWYQKAAAKGDVLAMTRLGLLYERGGDGVAQDFAKAREWHEKAAAKGNADAMFYLGRLYENGWGVAKDLAEAREWYQKAEAAGKR